MDKNDRAHEPLYWPTLQAAMMLTIWDTDSQRPRCSEMACLSKAMAAIQLVQVQGPTPQWIQYLRCFPWLLFLANDGRPWVHVD